MNNRTALRSATALGATLIITISCSPAPPAPPPPAPSAPASTPPPPPPPEPERDWREASLSPGTWIYREDDRGSVALFGPANSEASFVVRCNAADRRIYFSREGSLNGTGTMAFQASHGRASYAAQNVSGALPYVVAATNAHDDYLDKIAYSRGRISVAVTGRPLLVLPNWPEMIRVFEDCRG